MSTQIPDQFIFNHHRYSVVGVKGEGLFQPQSLDLTPLGMFTACWRGYICEYRLKVEQLVLESLWLSLGSYVGKTFIPHHPEINGVKPVVPQEPHEPFNNIYQELELEIGFTGGILIGDEFIRDLSLSKGFHPAWKYKTVLELIFEDGLILDVANVSDKVAILRKKMIERPLKPGLYASAAELEAWIRATFRLHYDI